MILLQSTILTICASAISAGLDQLLPTSNPVLQIEFHSESNVYVTTQTNTSTTLFYVFNWARNETLYTQEFQNVIKFFVTKSNNLYIFENDSYIYNRQTVYFGGLGEQGYFFNKIYQIPIEPAPFAFVQDHDGNIYFNTAFGVALLQPDKKIPVAILNLENFYINDDNSYAIDYYGNLYFGGTNGSSYKPLLAAINEAQIGEIPASATLFEAPNSELNLLTAIGASAYTDRIIIVGFGGNQARLVSADQNGFRDVVHAEYVQLYKKFYSTKERFYFISISLYGDFSMCYLNFLHREDSAWEFTRVLDSLYCDSLLASPIATDSAGNLFIPFENELIPLRNNETNYREVYFPSEVYWKDVGAIAVDKNDIVWILKGGLSKLNITESLMAEVVTDILTTRKTVVMKINDQTNEIFFEAEEGLFVYTEN